VRLQCCSKQGLGRRLRTQGKPISIQQTVTSNLTNDQLQLQKTLEGNGATISELKADGSIKLDHVTHIISATSDFPQYSLACDRMLPVLTPGWITASLLRNKQAPPRSFTPDPRFIFSGITICCAGLPTGDKDAIIGAVAAMGGQESGNLTKFVTHIVALSEEHEKCRAAMEKRMKCKIVLPHW
jgi:twin BRCT domain